MSKEFTLCSVVVWIVVYPLWPDATIAESPQESPTYSELAPYCANPHWFVENGKVGYRTPEGRVVVPAKFDAAADSLFCEGMGVVGMIKEADRAKPIGDPEFMWGVVDLTGKMLVSPQYDLIAPFSEGMAAVQDSSGRWGFMSSSGQIAIPPKFEMVGSFHEGLAIAIENGKYGFVDLEGKWAIEPRFLDAKIFSEGLSAVKCQVEVDSAEPSQKRALWGFIDNTGDFRIPPRFPDQPTRFREGLAGVEIDGRWGFINQRGEIVIPARFFEVRAFSEGLAAVRTAGALTYVWGFIDKKAGWVIPATFQRAKSFAEGFAPVRLQGKWGLINHAGQYVVRPVYCDLSGHRRGVTEFRTCLSGGILVDASGRTAVITPDDPQAHGQSVRRDYEVGLRLGEVKSKYGEPDGESQFIAKDAHTPLRVSLVRDYLPSSRHDRPVKELLYIDNAYFEKGLRFTEMRWYWLMQDRRDNWVVIANVFKPAHITF